MTDFCECTGPHRYATDLYGNQAECLTCGKLEAIEVDRLNAEIACLKAELREAWMQVNSLMRECDEALVQVPGVVIHHLRTILDEAEHHLPGSVAQNNIIYAANRALDATAPADAKAALDRLLRQARAEGMRKAYDLSGQYHQITHIRAAILAAAEQEGRGDE